MKKFSYILLLITCFHTLVKAQKMPDYGIYLVHLNDSSGQVKAHVNPVEHPADQVAERTYYWYSSNQIHTLQGGYSGKPLNGTYEAYSVSRNLREQGEFTEGLKDGLWKTWFDNGQLRQTITWKKGLRSGKFSIYDSSGKIIQSGNYSDDRLDGKILFAESGKPSKIIKYKDGKIDPDTGKSFFRRIHVFDKPMSLFKKKKAKPVVPAVK